MPERKPFLLFTRKFNELRLPYMVSGSVASIFYGEPRMTNDVDNADPDPAEWPRGGVAGSANPGRLVGLNPSRP